MDNYVVLYRGDSTGGGNELEHHGVLGMKWGVRNEETRARYANEGRGPTRAERKETKRLDKADARWANDTAHAAFAANNAAADNITNWLQNTLNKDARFKDVSFDPVSLKDPERAKIYQEYKNEYASYSTKAMNDALAKQGKRYSPSKKYQMLIINSVENGLTRWIGPADREMADVLKEVGVTLKHATSVEDFEGIDEDGIFTPINDENFLKKMDAVLLHHGVLGMKWGVWNEETRARRQEHKTAKQATKDAERAAVAKAAYGKGAGIQRRLIKTELDDKMKDPVYKKYFDEATENLNGQLIKGKAVTDSQKRAAKEQAHRTARSIAKAFTGTASLGAVAILYMKHKDTVDAIIKKAANRIIQR